MGMIRYFITSITETNQQVTLVKLLLKISTIKPETKLSMNPEPSVSLTVSAPTEPDFFGFFLKSIFTVFRYCDDMTQYWK